MQQVVLYMSQRTPGHWITKILKSSLIRHFSKYLYFLKFLIEWLVCVFMYAYICICTDIHAYTNRQIKAIYMLCMCINMSMYIGIHIYLTQVFIELLLKI